MLHNNFEINFAGLRKSQEGPLEKHRSTKDAVLIPSSTIWRSGAHQNVSSNQPKPLRYTPWSIVRGCNVQNGEDTMPQVWLDWSGTWYAVIAMLLAVNNLLLVQKAEDRDTDQWEDGPARKPGAARMEVWASEEWCSSKVRSYTASLNDTIKFRSALLSKFVLFHFSVNTLHFMYLGFSVFPNDNHRSFSRFVLRLINIDPLSAYIPAVSMNGSERRTLFLTSILGLEVFAQPRKLSFLSA